MKTNSEPEHRRLEDRWRRALLLTYALDHVLNRLLRHVCHVAKGRENNET